MLTSVLIYWIAPRADISPPLDWALSRRVPWNLKSIFALPWCNDSGYSVIVFECVESVVKTMYNLIAPHERREMNISNFFTQSCRRVCLNRNSRDSNMLVSKGYGRRYYKAQEYCSIYIDHELKVWFPNYLLLRLSKV